MFIFSIFMYHPAPLHHHANFFQRSNIFNRIFFHNQEICLFTLLDRTDRIRHIHGFGRSAGGGHDRLHGCHAGADHGVQFLPQSAETGLRQTGIAARHTLDAETDELLQ